MDVAMIHMFLALDHWEHQTENAEDIAKITSWYVQHHCVQELANFRAAVAERAVKRQAQHDRFEREIAELEAQTGA